MEYVKKSWKIEESREEGGWNIKRNLLIMEQPRFSSSPSSQSTPSSKIVYPFQIGLEKSSSNPPRGNSN